MSNNSFDYDLKPMMGVLGLGGLLIPFIMSREGLLTERNAEALTMTIWALTISFGMFLMDDGRSAVKKFYNIFPIRYLLPIALLLWTGLFFIFDSIPGIFALGKLLSFDR